MTRSRLRAMAALVTCALASGALLVAPTASALTAVPAQQVVANSGGVAGPLYGWGRALGLGIGVEEADHATRQKLPTHPHDPDNPTSDWDRDFIWVDSGPEGAQYGSATCAVTTAGIGYCWGFNSTGQVGDGTNSVEGTSAQYVSTPKEVAGNHIWKMITSGGSHTCGLTADGDAYCWGSNSAGALGTGDPSGPDTCIPPPDWPIDPIPCSTTPVPVSGGHKFSSIDAGPDDTCGITTDGYLHCWGSDDWDQMGSNSGGDQSTPQRVHDPDAPEQDWATEMLTVSVGVDHTCAIDVDNWAYCWGSADGQFSSDVPTRILGPTGTANWEMKFTDIAAGDEHTCAVQQDPANAWCWGRQRKGTLGNSSSGDGTHRPMLVDGGHLWADIQVSKWNSCGITANDQMLCWGRNGFSALGNGVTEWSGSYNTPEPPHDPNDSTTDWDTTFSSMALGRDFAFGIRVKDTQTITFTAPSDTDMTGGPVTVSATASSGLAVAYASTTPSVCTVGGSSVTLVSPGTCTITTSQPGDVNYAAAADVSRSFDVAAPPAPSLPPSSPTPGGGSQPGTGSGDSSSPPGLGPSDPLPGDNASSPQLEERPQVTIPDIGPPGPVLRLKAQHRAKSKPAKSDFRMRFKAPRFDGGSPITGYQFRIKVTGKSLGERSKFRRWSKWRQMQPPSTAPRAISTDLPRMKRLRQALDGVRVHVQVVAENKAGTSSKRTARVRVTTRLVTLPGNG